MTTILNLDRLLVYGEAWKDAVMLADNIKKYYNAVPLIKFSGRKGYHVDLFLQFTVTFDPRLHSLDLVKSIYERLQQKKLTGLNLATLDRQVLGDIKRLERVPYSVHEKSGQLCQPVDLDGNPISPEECDVQAYREGGLPTKMVEYVIHDLQSEEKWRTFLKRRMRNNITLNKDDPRMRPCIQAALSQPLHGGAGHKMRLAIALEHLHAGYNMDQVISLFQAQTDYNEAKTRYYIEDAMRKKYKPFKCESIRQLGYCLGASCGFKREAKNN